MRSFVDALSSPAGQARSQADILAAVESHISIAILARSIVGRAWESATAAQRARLCAPLLHMVASYLSAPFAGGGKVIMLPARAPIFGDRWEVEAKLAFPDGQSTNLSWRLLRTGAHADIYDASVEGISIVELLRSQFSEILRRDGIDALSEKLEAMQGRA